MNCLKCQRCGRVVGRVVDTDWHVEQIHFIEVDKKDRVVSTWVTEAIVCDRCLTDEEREEIEE